MKQDMKIIRQRDYATVPWKNGRGVTRQIHRSFVGDALEWRLSLAQVRSDGPFSHFRGLERILTVVEGQGMRLVGSDGEIDAMSLCPVRFSGDTDVMGYCRSRPIENFNVIFNPELIEAHVRVVFNPEDTDLICSGSETLAIFMLEGDLPVSGVPSLTAGDTCILGNAARLVPPEPGVRCAIVSLTRR